MFKSTLIAIMLFMMSLSAGAASSFMTHEKFVHLTDSEKNAYIIKLMELSVELESRYKHETAQHGFSQERFERYSKLLNSLKSLFLVDSAFAANSPGKIPNIKFDQMASEFDRLIKMQQSTNVGKKDETCIFAGWVSRVIILGGKPTCTHPDFIDGKGADRHNTRMAQESRGYPYPTKNSDCGKDNSKMIQCNPVIFGYKKRDANADTGSLFCVEAKDGALNSSFNCMQLALSDVPGGDTKQDRLSYLRQKLAGNKTVFKQIWDFTFKTCVCPTVADYGGTKTFGQSYQDHIRPHRTCYGLMEMMAGTANECTVSTSSFPLKPEQQTILTNLQAKMKRTSDGKHIDEGVADTEYSKFLTEMKDGNSAEYLSVCSLQPVPKEEPKIEPKDEPVVTPQGSGAKTYSCTGSCEMKPGTPADQDNSEVPAKLTCAYDIKMKEGDKEPVAAELETAPTEQPADKTKNKIDVKFKPKGGTEQTLSCDLTFKEPETPKEETPGEQPKIELEIDSCPGDQCNVTVKPDPKAEGWTVKWSHEKPEGITVPESWNDKPETPTRPEGAGGQTEEEEVPATPANKTSVKQPRVAKEYKVCAIYVKDGKDSTAGNDCEAIKPKTDAPAASRPAARGNFGYQNGLPQAPQVQIRGTSDTSAIGIK